ncbi:hypothetical protein F4561_001314 [Lipingzhangella halophila]|uniref:Uncharacterized protein n=1 Tax=Lipingzhangella halophila TaxID=1783352 RepID=A0A7W7W279_9ACTN|nr:DUF6221 family protein [Lipingzhangella halophila]MBB4930494.1 hypothetical protein [Lipingzhangella halophila]
MTARNFQGQISEIAAFLREQIDLEEHEAWALLSTLMDSTSVSEVLDRRIESDDQEIGARDQDEVLTQGLLCAKPNQRKAGWGRREAAIALDQALTLLERARGVVAKCERDGDVARLRRLAAPFSGRPGYREDWTL